MAASACAPGQHTDRVAGADEWRWWPRFLQQRSKRTKLCRPVYLVVHYGSTAPAVQQSNFIPTRSPPHPSLNLTTRLALLSGASRPVRSGSRTILFYRFTCMYSVFFFLIDCVFAFIMRACPVCVCGCAGGPFLSPSFRRRARRPHPRSGAWCGRRSHQHHPERLRLPASTWRAGAPTWLARSHRIGKIGSLVGGCKAEKKRKIGR